MIPVLIAPAYNRHDLLRRTLELIDHPVDRLLVVDNARSGTIEIPASPYFGDVRVHAPPHTSYGYGGTINLGIIQNAEAPWWMWVSNDVFFHAGVLDRIVAQMEETTEARIVTGGFTWGALNRACVQQVGFVDEWSFFPIYFDDNDYQYRCKVAGVDWVEYWADGSTHGDGGQHGGSQTIKSDPAVMSANHHSFTINRDRYMKKWGGMPREEVFTSPWNSGMPVWFTKPDIDGRRDRDWSRFK